MHGLLHNLALGVVLLHILGGCCVHHAHAGSPDCCRDERHHDDADGHGEQGCPTDGADPHPDGCDRSPCVFIVPETGGAAKLLGPLCADAAVSTPAVAVLLESPIASCFRPPSCCGRPSARLHLIHQVLLM